MCETVSFGTCGSESSIASKFDRFLELHVCLYIFYSGKIYLSS